MMFAKSTANNVTRSGNKAPAPPIQNLLVLLILRSRFFVWRVELVHCFLLIDRLSWRPPSFQPPSAARSIRRSPPGKRCLVSGGARSDGTRVRVHVAP